MHKLPIRNAIVFVALCGAYFAYLRFIANSLPESWGGEVNVLAVPFVLGAVCAFAFVGHLALRITLFVIAAALVLLTISGGGDPAKPGLHLWVIAVEVIVGTVGMLSAAFAARLVRKSPRAT